MFSMAVCKYIEENNENTGVSKQASQKGEQQSWTWNSVAEHRPTHKQDPGYIPLEYPIRFLTRSNVAEAREGHTLGKTATLTLISAHLVF